MSTLPIRRELTNIAYREVGTVEHATNSGKRVREYQAATSLKGTGWPWCAAFVCWCVREWAALPPVAEALRRQYGGKDLTKWLPRTAAAFGFETWAEDHGAKVLPRRAPLKCGDLMIFSMSHIGIVTTDDDAQTIWTIEGNTGAAGGRDGDGVWEKTRRRSEARSFIRLLD